MRNEEIGLNRSGLLSSDSKEEEAQPNRLLAMRNKTSVDEESKTIAHKCTTLYEII
jgi:hypothetical protein